MKTILIALILPLTAFAATNHIPSTQERAKGMFRAPSSSNEGKIDRKFQPIDHMIKGTSKSSQIEERKKL